MKLVPRWLPGMRIGVYCLLTAAFAWSYVSGEFSTDWFITAFIGTVTIAGIIIWFTIRALKHQIAAPVLLPATVALAIVFEIPEGRNVYEFHDVGNSEYIDIWLKETGVWRYERFTMLGTEKRVGTFEIADGALILHDNLRHINLNSRAQLKSIINNGSVGILDLRTGETGRWPPFGVLED